MHYGAGLVTGALGYELVYKLTKDKKKATVGAIAMSMLVGTLKETIDSRQPGNKFDPKDLLSTTLGGVTIGFTIKLFDKKKKRRR